MKRYQTNYLVLTCNNLDIYPTIDLYLYILSFIQKEKRQYRVREKKLCNEIRVLQSNLCEERLTVLVLKERLVQVGTK